MLALCPTLLGAGETEHDDRPPSGRWSGPVGLRTCVSGWHMVAVEREESCRWKCNIPAMSRVEGVCEPLSTPSLLTPASGLSLMLHKGPCRGPHMQCTCPGLLGGGDMRILSLWFSGTSKVNLVRIPSTASSPRDTALAAVICSALATVLLALLVLCVIYCKRQFVEKKPSCKS